MEWAVEVEDMTVAYTTNPVLWDVDMKVPIGSLAAIVGPNGAGKSTLLKAMLGLLTVISGSVKFYIDHTWPWTKVITRKSPMSLKAAVSIGTFLLPY